MNKPIYLILNNLTIILRHKRGILNYSQNELADKISTSLRTYQRIESGETEPSLSQLYKLSQILNFEVKDIFQAEENVTEDIFKGKPS